MRFRLSSLVPIAGAVLLACSDNSSPLAPEVSTVSSAAAEIDWQSIRDCGVDITQPGHYRLVADLVDCPAAASPLSISASDVVLDLNHHRIVMTTPYSPHYVGLHVGAVSNVQVLGPGTIQGFTEFGIEVVGATNLTIRRVTMRENAEAGVNGTGLTNALLHDNTFIHNRDAGAQLAGQGLRLLYNRVTEPAGSPWHPTTYALLIGPASSGVEVRGNVVTGTYYGITLRNTTGGLVTGNEVTGSSFGLHVELGSIGNRVIRNRFLNNDEIDMQDHNGCGPNTYRGNIFAVASPSCLQVPSSSY